MQLQFGAQVQSEDGDRLGELRGAVFDPSTGEVVSLVAQSAHMGERELLVPLEHISFTDDVTVQLRLAGDEFESLEEFSSSRNIAPPPDRDFADVDDDDDGLSTVTEVPPVGAATGIEAIAFTPIVQESIYVPTGDEVIDRTTEVWAQDGLIGSLAGVTIGDLDHRFMELQAREGTIFTTDVRIPVDLITLMRSDTIELSGTRDVVLAGGEA